MAHYAGIMALFHGASGDRFRLECWAAMGAAFGVVLFVRGFRMLQFKRLIMNTPLSKTRSASIGLIEVNGIAKGPQTIPAAITGDACYYYRAVALQLRQSGKSSNWERVAEESRFVPFFVEDDTGRLMVDPQGASLDIHRNFRDQFDQSLFKGPQMSENIRQFLIRNGVRTSRATRVEEYCIPPDYPLFVFGTLGSDAARPRPSPGQHVVESDSLIQSRLHITGSVGFRLFQAANWNPGPPVVPSNFRAPATASRGVQTPTRAAAPAPAVWSSVSMDEEKIAHPSMGSVAQQTALGWQRSNASVAALDPPDSQSDRTTLASQDAQGFDLNPSACLCKGTDKQPFMISWHSQREVVRSLAWKSALCIWAGPALTLASLYFLALTLGWT